MTLSSLKMNLIFKGNLWIIVIICVYYAPLILVYEILEKNSRVLYALTF